MALPLDPRPIVLKLLMYAVVALNPPLADVGGGTRVVVSGEGYPDDRAVQCVFGASTVPATYLDSHTLACVAPAENSTGSCSGEALEVSPAAAISCLGLYPLMCN